jgi:cardiolipin synthase (CMP-forming)
MNITIPTILTLIRLVFPFLFSIGIYYLVPLNYMWLNILLAVLFTAVSFTDYLDGYLARRWNQETELGRILDPVADKVFIAGPLIALASINKIYFYWAVLLISRELFISALRESSTQRGFSLPVSWWGKWKATFQYVYLALAIGAPWPWVSFLWLERLTLGGTLLLSGVSAVKYVQSFLGTLHQQSCIKDQDHEI